MSVKGLPCYRTDWGRTVDELVVAVELVPEGGVITAHVRPGVPVRIPLGRPLAGPDGTTYSAIDIVVDEHMRGDVGTPSTPAAQQR